jgi:hypothetical protein
MVGESFARDRIVWRVGLVSGLAVIVFTQFLIVEPWFGVPFAVIAILMAAAVTIVGVATTCSLRVRRAIRAGLLAPGSI